MVARSLNVKAQDLIEGKFTFIYCVQQSSDPFHFDPPGGWHVGSDCDVIARCQLIWPGGKSGVGERADFVNAVPFHGPAAEMAKKSWSGSLGQGQSRSVKVKLQADPPKGANQRPARQEPRPAEPP